jgi:type I restriction enzyme R subunit
MTGLVNTIAALKVVVQRPRDLTRAQLRELRRALDLAGYPEASLRRAWADAKNEEIAASIIGFVRQAAIGDPLIPYEDRVRAAMRRILATRQWTAATEVAGAYRRAGCEGSHRGPGCTRPRPIPSGWRLRPAQQGVRRELETSLGNINDEMWKKTG